MKMIVHQHIGMHSDAVTFGCLTQQLQEMEPVEVGAVNGLPLVTTGGNMISAAGPLNAQWPCHAVYRSSADSQSQLRIVDC
jgi:hypothetical protein